MHPIKAPIITSLGKWTKRYNLENPIKKARIKAKIPHLLFWEIITVEEEKEAIVCPEGKEKSLGAEISSCVKLTKSNGLILFTKGLRIIFPVKAQRKIPIKIIIPIFLYFFINIKIQASAIQKNPKSPSLVTIGINLSRKRFLWCS